MAAQNWPIILTTNVFVIAITNLICFLMLYVRAGYQMLSLEQLGVFTDSQAAAVTATQMNSMSAEQRKKLENLATLGQEELSNTGTGGTGDTGDSGSGALGAFIGISSLWCQSYS